MQFTRIPSFPSFELRDLINPSTPCLDEVYNGRSGVAYSDAAERY